MPLDSKASIDDVETDVTVDVHRPSDTAAVNESISTIWFEGTTASGTSDPLTTTPADGNQLVDKVFFVYSDGDVPEDPKNVRVEITIGRSEGVDEQLHINPAPPGMASLEPPIPWDDGEDFGHAVHNDDANDVTIRVGIQYRPRPTS